MKGSIFYPYALMIFVVILYAGNILVGKAINALPPFTIAFFRLTVAFVILLPIGWRRAWHDRLVLMKHKKPLLLMTLTGIALFNMFIYSALQFTSTTNVAVLESVIPAVTVMLSSFVLKERLQRLQLVGVGLSLVGAIWVVMDGRILQLATIDWNVGDAIMVGGVVSWAIYSIAVKRYMHLFPTYATLLVMTGISMVFMFPMVLIEWWITGIPPLGVINHVLGLLYLGIFPSFIALVCYNRAVSMLGASLASVFLNFLPVVTMIGAYFWLGETITAMQIVGTLAVMSGVILTTQIRTKRSRSSHRVRRGAREEM